MVKQAQKYCFTSPSSFVPHFSAEIQFSKLKWNFFSTTRTEDFIMKFRLISKFVSCGAERDECRQRNWTLKLFDQIISDTAVQTHH